MIQYKYLELGATGMARAYRTGPFSGHLGAALVAGYGFGEELPTLPDGVYRGIEGELDRILRGEESIWYDAEKVGIAVPELFAPFPAGQPGGVDPTPIAEALEENIDALHQSGHNVIFAGLAIRALKDHPQLATRDRLSGLVKLIRGFNGTIPGKAYLGKDRGGWVNGDQIKLNKAMDVEPYQSVEAMVRRTVDEVIASAHIRRRGLGSMWHIINHAAGLLDLATYGYRELARKGLAAHRDHLRLWRSLPDVGDEVGRLPKAAYDPRSEYFWSRQETFKRDDARLTHRIKTLYGFSRLMTVETDKSRQERAWDQLRYLMA